MLLAASQRHDPKPLWLQEYPHPLQALLSGDPIVATACGSLLPRQINRQYPDLADSQRIADALHQRRHHSTAQIRHPQNPGHTLY